MTPEMEAAAWEGLATNGPAQLAAEGSDAVARWLVGHGLVAISRSRLAELEQRVNRDPVDHTTHDAGQLAFHVRDLLDAASYPYDPDRPLHDQVRECCTEIRDSWQKRRDADRKLIEAVDRHILEKRRLDDLVTELRKHVDARENFAERTAEALTEARTRLAAACPCTPDAPHHEHLTGGYALTPEDWQALAASRKDGNP